MEVSLAMPHIQFIVQLENLLGYHLHINGSFVRRTVELAITVRFLEGVLESKRTKNTKKNLSFIYDLYGGQPSVKRRKENVFQDFIEITVIVEQKVTVSAVPPPNRAGTLVTCNTTRYSVVYLLCSATETDQSVKIISTTCPSEYLCNVHRMLVPIDNRSVTKNQNWKMFS